MVIISDYLFLSVKDCKRLGFFKPGTRKRGTIKWQSCGEVVAAISFKTDLRGEVPLAVAEYSYQGAAVRQEIALRFYPSNLVEGAGFYRFLCPETGVACDSLYLVEGRFISRQAFRPLYPSQAVGVAARRESAPLDAFAALAAVRDMKEAPHRKRVYQGKPTRYARKVEMLERRAHRYLARS